MEGRSRRSPSNGRFSSKLLEAHPRARRFDTKVVECSCRVPEPNAVRSTARWRGSQDRGTQRRGTPCLSTRFPGMNHRQGGPDTDTFDNTGVIESWVDTCGKPNPPALSLRSGGQVKGAGSTDAANTARDAEGATTRAERRRVASSHRTTVGPRRPGPATRSHAVRARATRRAIRR
jgi:hypothetical protein